MDNKKLLADLLAQPGKVGPEHVSLLQEMVQQFPYSQPIHLLLAKANASFVPKAALYSQGHVLFHVLNMVPVKAINAIEEETEADLVAIEDTRDEQEIFDEIGELTNAPSPVNQTIQVETPNNLPGIDSHLMDLPAVDDSFIESVAAVDFFAFEQKLSTDVVIQVPEIETVVPDEPERNFVSQYNDDKLPYTFLWWLAKTRKEHEQIFQPYAHASSGKLKPQPQNNQQQERADLNSLLMGTGKLNVKINFNLTDNNGAFTYSGDLGKFDLKNLNPLSKALGLIEIESGDIQHIDFKANGNLRSASGSMNMLYTNLKVKLLSDNIDGEGTKEKGFLSFLANAILVKNENPQKGEAPRTASMTNTRINSASFFNLMWKTVFVGIKDIVGVGIVPEKNPVKQQKVIAKKIREQKREDRKAARKARREKN
jgi:hypothetical protein